MEQISNPIAGCFVEAQLANDDDENSDDDGDDDMQFLAYKEVQDVRSGKSLVTSKKPKQLVGSLVDIETRKPINFRGNIHLPGQWWRVIALRTKKARDKKHYPSDMHALTYRLRDDPKRFKDSVVHLLLTKIGNDLDSEKKAKKRKKGPGKDSSVDKASEKDYSIYFQGKDQFYNYLRERDQYDDLDIFNLEERVTEFYESFQEEEENVSMNVEKDGNKTINTGNQTMNITVKQKLGYSTARDFKSIVIESFEFRAIKLSQDYPDLVRYLPQLFPYQFYDLVMLADDRHEKLAAAVENSPGHLAFKPVVAKECSVVGVETSHQALERSGLLSKVPQVEREAILMYEYIKRKTKEEGHTCVKFDAIMNYFGSELGLIEDAHQFLEKNKVTKTKMEGGYRMVYLTYLWEAERKIAKSVSSLFTLQEGQPWKLEVDWNSEQFTTIKEDPDQLRASQLIATHPVVAVSGKGGCGKTHVVTQVITAAKAASKQSAESLNDKDYEFDPRENQAMDDSDMFDYREPEQLKHPRSVSLLLTAPTGKAANLLGRRANHPSYTLHQVIFSFRNHNPNIGPWKHEDVNTLVVDECSLVAVTTFAFLIGILIDHAQLRRIVLLGDVRQLPSIEPGNFLSDLFQSLNRLGCGVELRKNHRAESQIVVDNATNISEKSYPVFVSDKFTLLKVPESNPTETGDDLVNDDTEIEVRKVLNHPALQDDSKSQFISFTRKICERINEVCCKKYSEHTTKTHKNRWDFQVNDKICCTKNGYVNTYEEDHGIMQNKKKKAASANRSNSSHADLDGTGSANMSIGLQKGDTDPGIGGADDSTLGEESGIEHGDEEEDEETEKIRLCNGEIFFIEDIKIMLNGKNEQREFFYLSDRDPDSPNAGFWVDKGQLRMQCRIRHAWARTIHTFQGSETDHIVYIVGKRNRHQNWQHVYTAITRGRKSVFIIGQESVLRQVIKTKETKRNTSLRKQLTELLQKNPDFISSQSVLKQSMLCMSPVPPARNPHLDMTEGVTGVLAALAEEHDGIEAEGCGTDHLTNVKVESIDKVDFATGEIGKLDIEAKSESGFVSKSKMLSDQTIDVSDVLIENQGSSRKSKLKLRKKTDYSYRELDSTNRSPVHFLMKKNSANANSPFNSGDNGNDGSYMIEDGESPVSLTEPRSNESMWSEADESQYASFLDATMYAINSGALKVEKDSEKRVNQSLSKIDLYTQGINVNSASKSSIETPRFTRLKPLFKTSLSGSELKNLGKESCAQNLGQKSADETDSAAGQWSDLPDEQYLTLNLEDIENMENDFDSRNNRGKSLMENKPVDSDDSDDFEDNKPYRISKPSLTNVPVKNGILNVNDFKDLDESLTDIKGEYRNSESLLKTPEKQVKVKDTPPLPSVPDTPLDQYSRKRRSVEMHEDMIKSPSKQRKDMITSPTKQRTDLSLTPLKKSLAELNFK